MGKRKGGRRRGGDNSRSSESSSDRQILAPVRRSPRIVNSPSSPDVTSYGRRGRLATVEEGDAGSVSSQGKASPPSSPDIKSEKCHGQLAAVEEGDIDNDKASLQAQDADGTSTIGTQGRAAGGRKRGRKRKTSSFNPSQDTSSTSKRSLRSVDKENQEPKETKPTPNRTVFVKLEKDTSPSQSHSQEPVENLENREASVELLGHLANCETNKIPQKPFEAEVKQKRGRGRPPKLDLNLKIESGTVEDKGNIQKATASHTVEGADQLPIEPYEQKKKGRSKTKKGFENVLSPSVELEPQSSQEIDNQIEPPSSPVEFEPQTSQKFGNQREPSSEPTVKKLQDSTPVQKVNSKGTKIPDYYTDVQWSNESVTGEAVIWGTQGINSLRKLLQIKLFVAESTGENSNSEQNKKQKTSKSVKPKATSKGGRSRPIKLEDSSRCSFSMGDALVHQTENSSESATKDDNQLENFSVPIQENGELIIDDNVAHFENVQSSPVTYKILNKGGRRKKRFEPEFHPVAPGDKPNNTYTEIIARALKENPEGLTVSEIYEWIAHTFPYYHLNDERWKNSVRHNLSISPYFRKGNKADGKAGHVWTIAEQCKEDIGENTVSKRKSGVTTRSRKQGTNTTASIDLSNVKSEAELAVLVNVQKILGNYKLEAGDTDNETQNVATDSNDGIDQNASETEGYWRTVEHAEEVVAVQQVLSSFNIPQGKDGEVLQIDMQDLHIQPSHLLTQYYSSEEVIFATASQGITLVESQTNTFVAAMDENQSVLSGPTAERVYEYVYSESPVPQQLHTQTLGGKSTQEQVDIVMDALHGIPESSTLAQNETDFDSQDSDKTQPLEDLEDTQVLEDKDFPMETIYDDEGQPVMFH